MDDDNRKPGELARIIQANSRPWNGFWYWRDKPVGEHGAAINILEAAGLDVRGLKSAQDPPDCEGFVDGVWSGVEVTELVHETTLRRSIKATKQRAAGIEPDRPEAYFVWERDDLLTAIKSVIERKDGADLKGCSYDRYILVIHADEFFLDNDRVEHFLNDATFTANLITDAYLGLSYDPKLQRYPVFRLQIEGKRW